MFLDQLSCTGKELAILNCRARPSGLAACDTTNAAGVHCTGNTASWVAFKKIGMRNLALLAIFNSNTKLRTWNLYCKIFTLLVNKYTVIF